MIVEFILTQTVDLSTSFRTTPVAAAPLTPSHHFRIKRLSCRCPLDADGKSLSAGPGIDPPTRAHDHRLALRPDITKEDRFISLPPRLQTPMTRETAGLQAAVILDLGGEDFGSLPDR